MKTQAMTHPIRVWTDTEGNTESARFIKVFAGIVYLETADGRKMTAMLSRISPGDRLYVEQVSKRTRDATDPKSYQDSVERRDLRAYHEIREKSEAGASRRLNSEARE